MDRPLPTAPRPTRPGVVMRAIVVGSAESVVAALEAEGVAVSEIEGVATGEALGAAGVETAQLLVVCEVAEATAIPIAKERSPDLRVVVYAADSPPDFVRGQVDLVIDPALVGPAVLAEELGRLRSEPDGSESTNR